MHRHLLVLATVFFWSLAAPRTTSAQNAAANDAQQSKAPHRFFDSLNLGLTVLESSALLADGVTTQYALKHLPGAREADPLARPFVDKGWPGQIVGGALVVSIDVGIRYWLHRTNHHRAERWMPMILTGYGAAGAIHNGIQIRRHLASDSP